MKIIKDKVVAGKRRITVELNEPEALFVYNPTMFYRLGGQGEDVVHGTVVGKARAVYWCSVSREWVPKYAN